MNERLNELRFVYMEIMTALTTFVIDGFLFTTAEHLIKARNLIQNICPQISLSLTKHKVPIE